MQKPDSILELARHLGFPIPEIQFNEKGKWPDKDFGRYKYILGSRGFMLDKDGKIYALALDYIWEGYIPFEKLGKLFPHLRKLSLNGVLTSHHSLASAFPQLEELRLSYSWGLKDYTFLAELKGLTTLYLGSNHIADATFLRNMYNLRELGLDGNPIQDPLSSSPIRQPI
ncbi:MAG: hypothetical protein AAFU33_13950 [Bacteroidota bacterium]